MVENNLKLNKKGDKIKIVGKVRFYNILGTTIQFAPVLIYLMIKFNMFTFNESGYSLTGYGFTALVILFLAFRSKIKEKLKEYEKNFGNTWARSKSGSISLIIAVILFLVYTFSLNFFLIFGIYAISTYSSLFFYIPYDELNIKRIKLQKMLEEENDKNSFENIKAKIAEINNV